MPWIGGPSAWGERVRKNGSMLELNDGGFRKPRFHAELQEFSTQSKETETLSVPGPDS